MKESPIQLEKQGAIPHSEDHFKNNLAHIKDTDWTHIDPMKILDAISLMKNKDLRDDTLYRSGLIIVVVNPSLLTPFPNCALKSENILTGKRRPSLIHKVIKLWTSTMKGSKRHSGGRTKE